MKKGVVFSSALFGAIIGFIAISNLAPVVNPGPAGAPGAQGSPGISGSPGPQGSPGPTPAAAYLVYTALLTQSNEDPPVATVLHNTLSGPIVWSYTGPGSYAGTLSGAFLDNKVVRATQIINSVESEISSFNSIRFMAYGREDDNTLRIKTFENGSYADLLLSATLIEIRVYP